MKKQKNERWYARIFHDVMDSPAWRSLTAYEQAIYLHLVRRYNGRNNGQISLSVREAATAINAAKNTAARALKVLTQKGFISVVKRGWYNPKREHGRATEYRLTEYPCDVTGKAASFDFRRHGNGSDGDAVYHQRDTRSVSPEGHYPLSSRKDTTGRFPASSRKDTSRYSSHLRPSPKARH
jgi:hypothetical protein